MTYELGFTGLGRLGEGGVACNKGLLLWEQKPVKMKKNQKTSSRESL